MDELARDVFAVFGLMGCVMALLGSALVLLVLVVAVWIAGNGR